MRFTELLIIKLTAINRTDEQYNINGRSEVQLRHIINKHRSHHDKSDDAIYHRHYVTFNRKSNAFSLPGIKVFGFFFSLCAPPPPPVTEHVLLHSKSLRKNGNNTLSLSWWRGVAQTENIQVFTEGINVFPILIPRLVVIKCIALPNHGNYTIMEAIFSWGVVMGKTRELLPATMQKTCRCGSKGIITINLPRKICLKNLKGLKNSRRSKIS